MLIEQLSVFVENEKGKLIKITSVLREAQVDIKALSLADTAEYGILRIIVDDPEKAFEALKEDGHTVSITKVIAIGVKDSPGGLCGALETLAEAGINVDYLYAYVSRNRNHAYVIIRVEDNEKAVEVLQTAGIRILKKDDIQ